MSFSELAYIDNTGIHIPDYPTVLDYLQTQYRAIYGEDVYLDSDSQDGQWVAIQALALFNTCQLAQSNYNSFSPLTALSDALSRQVKINGIARRESTFSQVDLDIVGQAGTVINNGAARDTLNQLWLLPSVVLIPDSGTITVTATAQTIGAIQTDADTITIIATPTRGWQTVNNPAPATPGTPIESDAELRARQTISVAQPARTVFESTVGAVASVPGVSRYRGYENSSDSTDSNGIPSHSISIIAEGGDDDAIAQAIWAKKTPGTGTYGTTEVIVYDQYGTPDNIKFYRPTEALIGVEVTIEPLVGFVSTTEDLIKASIANYLNNLRIGDDIFITKLYVPANIPLLPESDTFDITLLEINRDGGSFSSSNIDLAFNEVSVTTLDDITVIVL